MLRSAPARAALSSFSKRFQSAKAAQARWQQMVKESSSSIKFTASVQATSRMEETAENTTVAPAARAPPSAETDSSDWQAMLQAANKIDAGVKDEAKVTVKVSASICASVHTRALRTRDLFLLVREILY